MYTKHKWESDTHFNFEYIQYLPKDYDETKKYPLVFFLHGAGERGSNVEDTARYGFMKNVIKSVFLGVFIPFMCKKGLAKLRFLHKSGTIFCEKRRRASFCARRVLKDKETKCLVTCGRMRRIFILRTKLCTRRRIAACAKASGYPAACLPGWDFRTTLRFFPFYCTI